MQDRPSPDEHALELFVLPITPSPADPDSGTVDESKESHGLLANRPREGGEWRFGFGTAIRAIKDAHQARGG